MKRDVQVDFFPSLAGDAIVITGATASGKSDVAIELAKRVGGEILSLDSIAVYRGMDIGSAKPTPAQQAQVPHHLIDLVAPTEEFSVARYLDLAHKTVGEVQSRGATPIFVGGTPMFLKAVLRGFDPGPPADWEFRRQVEQDLEIHGAEALRDRLRQVDPLAEHRIDQGDTRRMIRALEVARTTGVPISHRQVQFDRPRSAEACRAFWLQWERASLHQRIERRVGQMFDAGLVDEVRGLLDQYGELSRTAVQAVGYREVVDHLQGKADLDSTINAVATHTRQLAKRQETWFRSFSEIRPVTMTAKISADPALVANQIVATQIVATQIVATQIVADHSGTSDSGTGDSVTSDSVANDSVVN